MDPKPERFLEVDTEWPARASAVFTSSPVTLEEEDTDCVYEGLDEPRPRNPPTRVSSASFSWGDPNTSTGSSAHPSVTPTSSVYTSGEKGSSPYGRGAEVPPLTLEIPDESDAYSGHETAGICGNDATGTIGHDMSGTIASDNTIASTSLLSAERSRGVSSHGTSSLGTPSHSNASHGGHSAHKSDTSEMTVSSGLLAAIHLGNMPSYQGDELSARVTDDELSTEVIATSHDATDEPDDIMQRLRLNSHTYYPKQITLDASKMNLELLEIEPATTHLLMSKPKTPHYVVSALERWIPVVRDSLIVLDLSYCNLTHIPDIISTCTHLQELDISGNALETKRLPDWLPHLDQLTIVIADHCNIESLAEPRLAPLTSLHTLSVRQNTLTQLPAWLSQLPVLDTFFVDDNPFDEQWRPIVAALEMQSIVQGIRKGAAMVPQSSAHSLTSKISWASLRSNSGSPSPSTPVSAPVSSRTTSGNGSGKWPAKVFKKMSKMRSASLNVGARDPAGPISPRETENMPPVPQLPSPGSPATPAKSTPTHRAVSEPVPPRSLGTRSKQLFRNVVRGTTTDMRTSRTAAKRRSFLQLEPLPQLEFSQSALSELREDSPSPSSPAFSTDALAVDDVMYHHRAGIRTLMAYLCDLGDLEAASHSSSASRKNQQTVVRRIQSVRSFSGNSRPRAYSTVSSVSSHHSYGQSTGVAQGVQGIAAGSQGLATQALGLPAAPVLSSGQNPSPAVSGTSSQSHSAGLVPPIARRQTSGMSAGSSLLSGVADDGAASPAVSGSGSIRGSNRASASASAGPSTPKRESLTAALGHTPASNASNHSTPKHTSGVSSVSVSSGAATLGHLGGSATQGSVSYASAPGTHSSHTKGHSGPPPPGKSSHRVSGASTGHSSHPKHSSSTASTADISSGPPSVSGHTSATGVGSYPRSTYSDAADVIDHEYRLQDDPLYATLPAKVRDDPERRLLVINEIINTEVSYLRSLQELCDIYVRPAAEPVDGGKETVVPALERRIVFGTVEAIKNFHEQIFLPELLATAATTSSAEEKRARSKEWAVQVSDVFLRHAEVLRIYSSYVNSFDGALARLQTWGDTGTSAGPGPGTITKSRSFRGRARSSGGTDAQGGTGLTFSQLKRIRHFLKKAKAHPRHSQISLESYLLLPVQRVPRYRLLLESLVAAAGGEERISEAYLCISALTADMNERKRESEGRERLLEYQQRLGAGKELVAPHRYLVREGALGLIRIVTRTVSTGRVPFLKTTPCEQRVTALLCSDVLVLLEPAEDGTLSTLASMALDAIQMSIFGDQSVLRIVYDTSIMYLQAASEDDARQWLVNVERHM